jgi:hypothetical protein
MALHQAIQRVLLFGTRIETLPTTAPPAPPQRLVALIAALGTAHQGFDKRAVDYGHRYRSGFWAIYLLSALAVLFAILPLALGWDASTHSLHPYAGFWALAEVGVIAVVSAIYWRGHRRDWQGEWLQARTTAELTWYLPLVAPLVDFAAGAGGNWYDRVFETEQPASATEEITRLCAANESVARESLKGAWDDPSFVDGYALWTRAVLEEQRHYHHRIAARQHALQHRVHAINTWLFGVTAVAALTHLVLHTLWLSLVTTFFPALGASLHGALAQSEAYRLSTTSERLVIELQAAAERVRAALDPTPVAHRGAVLREAVADALALILEEHQDWQMLVRPHHLPLA